MLVEIVRKRQQQICRVSALYSIILFSMPGQCESKHRRQSRLVSANGAKYYFNTYNPTHIHMQYRVVFLGETTKADGLMSLALYATFKLHRSNLKQNPAGWCGQQLMQRDSKSFPPHFPVGRSETSSKYKSLTVHAVQASELVSQFHILIILLFTS